MMIITQKPLLRVWPYNQKRVTQQGGSRHSSSRANFLFLYVNFWPSFLWKSKLARPGELRQAGDPSTEEIRLTGPKKYHLNRFTFLKNADNLGPVYMEWGTPVKWGWFLLFSRSGGHKTKETYPTRPGSHTPCKQGLSLTLLTVHKGLNIVTWFWMKSSCRIYW